jgi:hypothetical protein
MPPCIYCRVIDVAFTRDEHPYSESLGVRDVVMPPGLVCDGCNAYFGHSVEQAALDEPPFCTVRLWMGIRSKSLKRRWFKTQAGVEVRATEVPGQYEFRGTSEQIEEFRKPPWSMALPVEPANPRIVCRLLARMAIATLALKFPDEVMDARYDPLRRFARFGDPGLRWWYVEGFDDVPLGRWLTAQTTPEDKDAEGRGKGRCGILRSSGVAERFVVELPGVVLAVMTVPGEPPEIYEKPPLTLRRV